jgi:thiol-disulfide isomerase/thioredoxin
MKYTSLIVLLVFTYLYSAAQLLPKPVVEVDLSSRYDNTDTSKFYITKIDTNIFKEMLVNNNKVAIQFWQPWCSGITDLIPNIHALKSKLEAQGYTFLLISDNQPNMDYFKLRDGRMGMVVYYFSKYGIHFPTYIMGKNESIKTYQKLIADFLHTKARKDYYCCLIADKSLLFHGYTYNFYKKILK